MNEKTFKESIQILPNRKTCNDTNAERTVELKKYIQHLNELKSKQSDKTDIDKER